MPSTETGPTVWSGVKLLARAFAAKQNNWLVLTRNAIPVVGVYFLGWPQHLTVFSYWVDGVSLFALLVATVVRRVVVEESRSDPPPRPLKVALNAVVGWVIVFGMFGIPYWIAFAALEMPIAVDDVLHDAARSFSFACIVIGNFWNSIYAGLMSLSNVQFKQRVQSGLQTLITRAVLMMLMTSWGLGFLLVPFMALVLTGVETWPSVLSEVARINTIARTRAADATSVNR